MQLIFQVYHLRDCKYLAKIENGKVCRFLRASGHWWFCSVMFFWYVSYLQKNSGCMEKRGKYTHRYFHVHQVSRMNEQS